MYSQKIVGILLIHIFYFLDICFHHTRSVESRWHTPFKRSLCSSSFSQTTHLSITSFFYCSLNMFLWISVHEYLQLCFRVTFEHHHHVNMLKLLFLIAECTPMLPTHTSDLTYSPDWTSSQGCMGVYVYTLCLIGISSGSCYTC